MSIERTSVNSSDREAVLHRMYGNVGVGSVGCEQLSVDHEIQTNAQILNNAVLELETTLKAIQKGEEYKIGEYSALRDVTHKIW